MNNGTVIKRRKGVNKINVFLVWVTIGVITPRFAYSITPEKYTLTTLPTDSLALEQCIDIALKNSPEIAIAKGDVTKAKINLKDARSGFLPKLDLSGGYNLTDTYYDYSRLEWSEDPYTLSLRASMTPYNGGRTLINFVKSRESLSLAKQGYRLTEILLILDVIRKYYNLLETSDILKLKKESLDQKRTHLEYATAQFDLGLAPRADILKAEVDVVNAEVDSLQTEGDLKLAYAELNDVMGISLDYPIQIKPVDFIREEPPNFDDCLHEAFKNRPELLQQKTSLSIRKYNLRLAQINRLPTFTITGSYNVYADKFAFAGLPINRTNWNDNTNWRVGIGLSFPIFDGGVGRRAIQAAKIDLNEAKLNYTDLEKEINLEVKLAHLNFVTAFKKIDLTEKQVESAEENYNAASGRYRTGVAPITEVIDAGVALTNSKVNHTKAIYDYLLADAILKKAMGQLPY